jgi:hypothetical protein
MRVLLGFGFTEHGTYSIREILSAVMDLNLPPRRCHGPSHNAEHRGIQPSLSYIMSLCYKTPQLPHHYFGISTSSLGPQPILIHKKNHLLSVVWLIPRGFSDVMPQPRKISQFPCAKRFSRTTGQLRHIPQMLLQRVPFVRRFSFKAVGIKFLFHGLQTQISGLCFSRAQAILRVSGAGTPSYSDFASP